MSQSNIQTPGAQTLAEAHQKCRELYKAGEPMFTKERLRNIQEQIKAGHISFSLDRIDGGRTTQMLRVPEGRKALVKFFTYQMITQDSHSTRPFPYCTYAVTSMRFEDDYWVQVQNFPVPTHILRHISGSGVAPEPETGTSSMSGRERQQRDWQARFSMVTGEWERSKSCQNLQDMIIAAIDDSPDQWAKVDKIVCLALGEPYASRSQASFTQHAMVQTIANMLEEEFNKPIRKLTQDPLYCIASKEGLARHGFEIVDEPGSVGAFLEIEDNTIVVAIFPDFPFKQIVADLARPQMLITSKITPEIPEIPDTLQMNLPYNESPRTTDMWKEYREEAPFVYEGDALRWARGTRVMFREAYSSSANDTVGSEEA